jgi:hypothetical protein
MHLEWSAASLAASQWFDESGPWIIEGVAVPRALRKWRDRNPNEPPPCDKIINLTTKYRDLAPGAITMGKGIDKVMTDLWAWIKPITEIR